MAADELVVDIGYTVAAGDGVGNGIVIGGADATFALTNLTAFEAQHGAVPAPPAKGAYSNDVIPVTSRVRSGRGKTRLATHGFELVSDLQLPPAPSSSEESSTRDEDDDEAAAAPYLRCVEDVAMAATGASFAKAYCRAARGKTTHGSKVMGYALYAHSDQAHLSWSANLPNYVDSWDSVGPPGLSRCDAERAATASRYAVLSAWRYEGPAAECRHSHLALLDPASVRAEDALHFEIRTPRDTFGSNYRLRAPTTPTAHHDWLYFPRMKAASELLLFIVFDSRPSFPTALPIPTVLHSAFRDPTASPHEPERRSLDVRVLLAWD
mmetsp:Transcript_4017/g.12479  ORF Transcript_4017/g.12479 Transcript_4017/m.12479 type:complete len:324 (+) Transcript_4017:3-974(+)